MVNMELLIKEIDKNKKNEPISLVRCHCGKEFKTRWHDFNRGKVNSCGCSRRANLKGKVFGLITVLEYTNKSDYTNVPLWLCKCDCGKILELSTTKLLRRKGRWSCGCSKTSFRKKRGKNHHWYNNDLPDEERKYRKYREATSFFRMIFERDNYLCVMCGQKGGKLNAHHLDGYHWCKSKRCLQENGVTLCEYCHKLFHRKYGKINNTRFQFLEFKRDYACYL